MRHDTDVRNKEQRQTKKKKKVLDPDQIAEPK